MTHRICEASIQNRANERAQFTGRAYGFASFKDGEYVFFETEDRTYVVKPEGVYDDVRLHVVKSLEREGLNVWYPDVAVTRSKA